MYRGVTYVSDGKKIPQQSFTIVDAIFWFLSSIHTKFMPTKIPPLRTDHSLAGNLEVAFERSVWTQRCHQQLEGQTRKSNFYKRLFIFLNTIQLLLFHVKDSTTLTCLCQKQRLLFEVRPLLKRPQCYEGGGARARSSALMWVNENMCNIHNILRYFHPSIFNLQDKKTCEI